MAEQQTIDWSFFSMARYLLTADPADGSVIPGRAWDGFLERLAEAGLLGNAAFMSFEFFDGATQVGSLLAADLRPDASGRFEVMFGPSKSGHSHREGRWHEIVPGTSYLLSREFFSDWGTAEPSVMQIEWGVANWLDTLGHQQGSVHLRFLPPADPGAPVRRRPAGRLADTRDDWTGWAEQKHPDAQAIQHPRPTATRRAGGPGRRAAGRHRPGYPRAAAQRPRRAAAPGHQAAAVLEGESSWQEHCTASGPS